jgi:hypothetical protein
MPKRTKKRGKRQAKKTQKIIFRFDAAKIHPASLVLKRLPN